MKKIFLTFVFVVIFISLVSAGLSLDVINPIGSLKNYTQNTFTTTSVNVTCDGAICNSTEVFLYRFFNYTEKFLPNNSIINITSPINPGPIYTWNTSEKNIISIDDNNFVKKEITGVNEPYAIFSFNFSGYSPDLDLYKNDTDFLNITTKGYGSYSAGSCATSYSYDGLRYYPDFFINAMSPHKLWESPSYGILPNLKKANGKYHIGIYEEVEETQYLDELQLWKVIHQNNTEVLPEQLSGDIHIITEKTYPNSAIDSLGNAYEEEVSNQDNNFFVSDMSNFDFDNPAEWDYLDLTFDKVSGNVDFGIRAKDTGLIHSVWKNVVVGAEGIGAKKYTTLNEDMEFFQNLTEWVQSDAMMHLYQEINGEYIYINSIEFGSLEVYHSTALNINNSEKDLKLRLVFIPYSFQIDEVFIDKTINEEYQLIKINAIQNDSSNNLTIGNSLIEKDDNYFTLPYEDYIKLDFYENTNPLENEKESFIIYSVGYSESYAKNPSVIKDKNMPLLRELAINNTLARYLFIEPFYGDILKTSYRSLKDIYSPEDYSVDGDMFVETIYGYKQIKDLTTEDFILNYYEGVSNSVEKVEILKNDSQLNKKFILELDNGDLINTTSNQKFYTGINPVWADAYNLRVGDYLYNSNMEMNKIIDINSLQEEKIFYEISLPKSNYFMNDYLVHNTPLFRLYLLNYSNIVFGFPSYSLLDSHSLTTKDTLNGIVYDFEDFIKNDEVRIRVNGGTTVATTSSTQNLYIYYLEAIFNLTNSLIPSGSGSPLYVNESNPQIINISDGETKEINFSVYGSGNVGYNELEYFGAQYFNNSSSLNFSRSFNVTIIAGEGDTCVYGGSGNWFVDCSENCTVDSNYEVDGNLSFEGAGEIIIDGNLTFISSGQKFTISESCKVALSDSGGIN